MLRLGGRGLRSPVGRRQGTSYESATDALLGGCAMLQSEHEKRCFNVAMR